jgi:uncharacterized protein (UPF0548 family)
MLAKRMKIRPCILNAGLDFEEAKTLSRNFEDQFTFPEETTSIELGASGPIKKWCVDFLFDYAIFPSSIMRFDAEWKNEKRRMAVGDVILQRAIMPPVGFGLCMDFAVRISQIFEEANRIGFAYETLSGHAESGVSEFYLEERSGELFFTIHTFSQPGHWTSRLGSRVFTLPYQAWCTRQALRQVKKRFKSDNKIG